MTKLSVFLLIATAVFLSGCGDSGPPRIPVKGKITYAGGDWPKPATLDFTAEKAAEGMPNLPASVEIKPDGKFETKLVPGEYVINVTCWEKEPEPDNPNTAKSYVPDKYHRPGPDRLRVSVPLGSKGPIEVDYDIVK